MATTTGNGMGHSMRMLQLSLWIVLVFAVVAIGGVTMLMVSRTAMPDTIEGRVGMLEDSLKVTQERLLYTVCSQVPPNTRRELRALRVDCGSVAEELERLQGATR